MTIIIDGTVGANKAVVLDANGKLPAIDGSLVTTLNATQVTTGSIATANIDTGTTTGKVLVLDGSGAMPAIAAGAMTGVSSATKSASDPTITTNPSTGLGTKWINTTSGEIFILTDATAGENVWTSTGGTSGDVAPYYYGGEAYGYSMGGGPDSSATQNSRIDQYSFTSDGNGVASGSSLSATRVYLGSVQVQSSTDGYCHGGYAAGYLSKLDKFSFASAGTATLIGSITTAGASSSGCNSDTYGYRVGGGNPMTNVIDRWPFASDGNAVDVGDLLAAVNSPVTSTQGITYGYVFSGHPSNGTNQISKFSLVSSANAVSTTQTLTTSRSYTGGHSSQTYGYVTGGTEAAPHSDHIDKYAFDSSSNATDIGNLTYASFGHTSSSSTTYGYAAGGNTPSHKIMKFSFASDGDATTVGDLPYIHLYAGGCHN